MLFVVDMVVDVFFRYLMKCSVVGVSNVCCCIMIVIVSVGIGLVRFNVMILCDWCLMLVSGCVNMLSVFVCDMSLSVVVNDG